MKKQILDALKAKFVGVSENILNRIAEKLAKTVTTEEGVATAIEGVTLQQVLESYGDSRATEATQTAISNYEKKYGLKEGQKVQGGAPESEPDKETKPAGEGDLAAIIKEAIKPLQDEITTLKAGKIVETRKQKLDTIISKLPENLRKPYSRTPVADLSDDDFEQLTSEIQTEVESLVTETNVKGAVFGRPVGNGASQAASAKEATEEEANSIVERMNI